MEWLEGQEQYKRLGVGAAPEVVGMNRHSHKSLGVH